MEISLSTSAATHRSHHVLQQRFDKLRKQLQRQEHLKCKLAADLDALVERYQSCLRDADHGHLDPLIRLAERLIEFFSRKSLCSWQREELSDWITETIQRVQRMDAAAGEQLHARFRASLSALLGLSEAEMDAQVAEFSEYVEAAFEEAFRSTDSGTKPETSDDPQGDLFGDEAFTLFDDEGDTDHDWTDTPKDVDSRERTRQLMDGTWARRLFRRAAQALHPDRELDPLQRRHKQTLMQQLLVAREQGDIITLLTLHGEAVGSDELALAETEMAQACELMEIRLEQLREERNGIIHDNPLRSLVYQLFYSTTRKVREQRFKAWEREMRADVQDVAQLYAQLRNLGILKGLLADRREQRVFSSIEDMIFGF
ncbi:hypothetical protein BI364_12510 [Acidihalobacter yilgarnensis]|uniref:J domain-containing protein n=1 Tax=Acidihalobacter yilgarnensis TaxID=2819280 RepID=A0A1D8IQK0_9GAMM|nr:hypothetical protein [Acidihalobacter yilgarnensis]AOU98674.1 hypothetical protein BI364_12510 [Acidihalobacter yilgarnensis]